ncbi:hypothetical protein IMCC3317_32960 [Kordia antarctica]|uniref:Uncharacterized protein n=1 Tax=Kordia antarctica TaxID=1218801 RepID=A0A7L4ZMJ5_9FLAO|nr:hypothetical protein IMCC3317_32960 [Kordia antarctica]
MIIFSISSKKNIIQFFINHFNYYLVLNLNTNINHLKFIKKSYSARLNKIGHKKSLAKNTRLETYISAIIII